jgi:signal transduction histidine kinase
VVDHYLDNALKYSAEDRPVVAGVEVVGAAARVWVRDMGPGVPPAEQERIWDRFYRPEGVEHRSGSSVGLGLGLYISRTIVERHGGRVGVEDAPGGGAIFWFSLPLL